ncbi:MAG: hypothetical protein K9H58_18615 [Bacteroidales bacterium]|nr:hypothetical protein [Bacteroidales bacterium]
MVTPAGAIGNAVNTMVSTSRWSLKVVNSSGETVKTLTKSGQRLYELPGVEAVNTSVIGVAKAAQPKSYAVYQGLDELSNIRYVGITNRNVTIRFGEHINSGSARSLLDYEVINGATNLTKTQARIWEQTLINQYGLQKNGGLLFNEINSIAPNNWFYYGIYP